MARVAIPVDVASKSGTIATAETSGDATNHHSVANNGRVMVMARNNGATPRNLTVYVTKQVDGQTPAAVVTAVAAGETRWFGPYSTANYSRSLSIDVAHSDLKLRAVRI